MRLREDSVRRFPSTGGAFCSRGWRCAGRHGWLAGRRTAHARGGLVHIEYATPASLGPAGLGLIRLNRSLA